MATSDESDAGDAMLVGWAFVGWCLGFLTPPAGLILLDDAGGRSEPIGLVVGVICCLGLCALPLSFVGMFAAAAAVWVRDRRHARWRADVTSAVGAYVGASLFWAVAAVAGLAGAFDP